MCAFPMDRAFEDQPELVRPASHLLAQGALTCVLLDLRRIQLHLASQNINYKLSHKMSISGLHLGNVSRYRCCGLALVQSPVQSSPVQLHRIIVYVLNGIGMDPEHNTLLQYVNSSSGPKECFIRGSLDPSRTSTLSLSFLMHLFIVARKSRAPEFLLLRFTCATHDVEN